MIAGEYLPRIGYTEPGMRICTNTVGWDSDKFETDPAAAASESLQFYNLVKEQLADPTADPIYAVVLEGSNGKLVIGGDIEEALGGVYAQVVQAYTNADTTLSFKIQFIRKPE